MTERHGDRLHKSMDTTEMRRGGGSMREGGRGGGAGEGRGRLGGRGGERSGGGGGG